MEKEKIRIGKAAELLGVSIQTLRNWEKTGKLKALRSSGRQRYYNVADIERFKIDIVGIGLEWAMSVQATILPDQYYCELQDRFTVRLNKFGRELLVLHEEENNVSLLLLIVGEIGDNSFAHNIGRWPDVLGVYFAYDTQQRRIVLADRGIGVRATLARVRPSIGSDTQALQIAFHEVISGRNPERRGNGLKVVRRTVEQKAEFKLLYKSGLAQVDIWDNLPMRVSASSAYLRGTFAVITY